MSQPGVKHIEVRYPQGDAVLVYDGSQITLEEVVQAVRDKRPDLEIFIEADRPLP